MGPESDYIAPRCQTLLEEARFTPDLAVLFLRFQLIQVELSFVVCPFL
jgi:hypothetical protein